ncbi:hypothetical protein B566_EDAN008491 [Ephemera danica]|nr:hypothetical protein B566_EDAN008491 [Ephemera danica]
MKNLMTSSFLDSHGPAFLNEPPSRVDFSNTTGARIECSAHGSPTPTLSWLSIEGKPIASIPGIREILKNGSLVFLPFQPSSFRQDVHSATYRCMASNIVGKIISRDIRVRAVVLQHYEVEARVAGTLGIGGSRGVNRGGTAVLKCLVPSAVRDFITVTSWLQDSSFNIYPSIKGDGKFHMLPSGELLVRHVDESDRYRSYQCRAVNRLSGTTQLSVGRGARIVLTDTPMPSSTRPLDKQITVQARKDQSAVLPCITEANPPQFVSKFMNAGDIYSWFRLSDRPATGLHSGQQLRGVVQDDRIFTVADGECLAVLHVQPEDAGKYVCVANNTVGTTRLEITLHVLWPLSASLQPPHATVDMGRRAQFACSHVTTVSNTIMWLKDGQVVQFGGRMALQSQGRQIVIENVQREDAGMYQCFVRTDDDSAQGAAELRLGAAHPQLVYKFISQTLQPGPPVSLKFLIGQYVTIHGDVISHVNISSVQVEDGGTYQCTALNRVGEVSHSAALRIYGVPSIREMPNISAVAGEPLQITCPVAGYPIDTITWEKGERKLPLNRRQHVFPNGTLVIENVQREADPGIYTCMASNKQGRSAFQSLELSVIVPPRITPFSFQTDLHVGDRAGVQCFITKGDLPLEIKWQRDGATIAVTPAALSADSRNTVVVRQLSAYVSSLSIDELLPEHAANYTCVATNNAASAQHSSQLLVNVPPRWIREPQDQNVTRDSSVQFECQAEGFPTPNVVWRKVIGRQPSEYQDLTVRSRGVQLFANGTLLIQQAFQEHQGYYLCEATNGIGAGLSAVVFLNVHVPPEFEVKSSQTSVRRGSPVTLKCQARGDAPMNIAWQRDSGNSISQADPRYNIKESESKEGYLSELTITTTSKSDSGSYSCVATNPFGRDHQVVHLLVQGSDGSGWDGAVLQSAEVAGSAMVALVAGLLPATQYRIRVLAENEQGPGEASEALLVRTESEAPAGAPQSLVVEPASSSELQASWLPPPRQSWHGDLLGYYVGYRETGVGRSSGYNFTTVPFNKSGIGNKGTTSLVRIRGLKKFRKYGVVVQAFNEKGPGPMSIEVVAQTFEDVPSAPPSEIKCQARSSQSLVVSWQPPPHLSQNGIIQGYKVAYENLDETPQGYIEAETKVTLELTTELHGLQKYSNYSLQIWAFTRVGDGEKSIPIYCNTDEDVPEPPADVKVASSSSSSIIVSWLPSARPNGEITSYNVYMRVIEGGQERNSLKKRLPASQTHCEFHDLSKKEAYEFWVTGLTKVGEGQSTQVVYATLTSRVPASIVSFGRTVTVLRKKRVQLACLAVGVPAPERSWLGPNNIPITGDRFKIHADGSLFISDVNKPDEGNYTCNVRNEEGANQIQYPLQVQVAPSAPVLHVTPSGTTSLNLRWVVRDTGGSAIRGFILNFRRGDHGAEWEEQVLDRKLSEYALRELECGTEYHLYLIAVNRVGSGAPSKTVITKTDGSKPGVQQSANLISMNMSTVTLNLNNVEDNGCIITAFTIEYKEKSQDEWITVANMLQIKENYSIVGLWPGTHYIIRILATNSAGSTSFQYPVTTYPALGGTPSPSLVEDSPHETTPFFSNISTIITITAALLFIFMFVGSVCLCRKKRGPGDEGQGDRFEEAGRGRRRESEELHETQSVVALNNKQNLAQREQYYAAVQKGAHTPVRSLNPLERIPEYAEDIYPYATFHVQSQHRTASPANFQTFLYQDHRLTAMESIPLKKNPVHHDDYTQLRQQQHNMKSKSVRSESEDYDSLGSDSEPEQPNVHLSHCSNVGPRRHREATGRRHKSSTSDPSPMNDRRLSAPVSTSVPSRRPPISRVQHSRSGDNGRRAANTMVASEADRGLSQGGFPVRLEPPTGFSDGHELSEAECDMDTIRRLKLHQQGMQESVAKMGGPIEATHRDAGLRNFTITV